LSIIDVIVTKHREQNFNVWLNGFDKMFNVVTMKTKNNKNHITNNNRSLDIRMWIFFFSNRQELIFNNEWIFEQILMADNRVFEYSGRMADMFQVEDFVFYTVILSFVLSLRLTIDSRTWMTWLNLGTDSSFTYMDPRHFLSNKTWTEGMRTSR
jgi:hypothetical protein